MKNRLSNKIQVGMLKAVGFVLIKISYFLPGYQERIHPFGFGFASWLIDTLFFKRNDQYSTTMGPLKKAKIVFNLNDKYWTFLLLRRIEYEKEIARVLEKACKPDCVFVDCGSNIGYWSSFATDLLKPENIIAIEASPTTFDQLLNNSKLNGGFTCINAAIYDRCGRVIHLTGSDHSNLSIENLIGNKACNNKIGVLTKSITLDQIARKYLPSNANRIILKLDIEGSEIKALMGAKKLLELEPLIIYEDHGNDPSSKNSQYIKNQIGYDIYTWTAQQGLIKVEIQDIVKIKKSKKVGYNFFAVSPKTTKWEHLFQIG